MSDDNINPLEQSIKEMMADPDRKKRLLAAADKAFEDKLIEQFKWSLPDTISKVCAEFIEEEIAPAVAKHLQKQKGAIVKSAIEASNEIGAKLSEAMVAKAVNNLTGYRMGSLMKELFQ